MIIDDSHPEVPSPRLPAARSAPAPPCVDSTRSTRPTTALADYAGPLLSDLDFAAFSHSALVRIADEVVLQMHLLALGFVLAVAARRPAPTRRSEIFDRQLVGIAGIAAERLHRALGLPGGVEGALRVLELHPLLNPAPYVEASVDGVAHRQPRPPPTRTAAGSPSATRARSAPCRRSSARSTPRWTSRSSVATGTGPPASSCATSPAEEFDEVAVTRISTGASFVFEPRLSLPITPV